MKRKKIKSLCLFLGCIVVTTYYSYFTANTASAANNHNTIIKTRISDSWISYNEKWYFYDKDSNLVKGWLYDNSSWYFMDNTTGEMQIGWLEINNKVYYLSNSGAMVTGWKFIDNNWYYFKNSGEMVTGWLSNNGKWYYLHENGTMASGFINVGGNVYYLDNSGAMKIGWQLIDSKWYYFLNSGAMKTGWLYDSGIWYYLYNDGSMARGWIEDGVNSYYLDNSGAMKIGWIFENNNWYYLKSSGEMAKGWLYLNNKWYLLNENGQMLTGWNDFNEDRYYLNLSGEMQIGWKYDDYWYYLESSGRMLHNEWKDIDGVRYWFNVDGKMASQDTIIGGKMYKFDSSGKCLGITDINQYLYVEVINTGDSESIYIELPNGDDVLIDGGEPWNGQQVVEFLKTRNLAEEDGIEDIDYVINTHPHSDHVGGLVEVFKNFKVNNLYYPFDIEMKQYEGFEGSESIENHGFLINCMNYCYQFYEQMIKEAEKQGTNIKDTVTGEYIDSNNILKFIHPNKVYRQNNLDKDPSDITGYDYCYINNDSAVIMLEYNNFKMLLTADIHVEAERDMVNMGLINDKIDVLKVSHHGYATSTSRELLEITRPTFGIITRSKDVYNLNVNLGDVTKNLNDYNVKLFETWRENNIKIYVSDKTWNIEYD